MNNSRGESRSNFGIKTAPTQEFKRGTLLKSKSGLTTVRVVGFGFLGHSYEVIECHPLSVSSVGDRGWTGHDWAQGWEVVSG